MADVNLAQPKERLNAAGRRRLVVVFAMIGVYALLLFVSAGTLRWWNAWAYLGLSLLAMLTGGLYVAIRHPATINERGRRSDKTKPFDKTFARLTVPLHLSLFVVAGLDYRFGWSAMPLWAQMAGVVAMLPAMVVPYWVMAVNAYAATTVRVETERGHHVITNGPYRIVRHPLYAGSLLGYAATPFFFGAWSTVIPAALLMGLFVWRTANEDRTLLAELPGYPAYAQATRYRLAPGVW